MCSQLAEYLSSAQWSLLDVSLSDNLTLSLPKEERKNTSCQAIEKLCLFLSTN